MSRSYKKTPITKGCGYGRFGKKYANRILSRNNEIFKRSLYKRNFNSWDINDYISYFSLEMIIYLQNMQHVRIIAFFFCKTRYCCY